MSPRSARQEARYSAQAALVEELAGTDTRSRVLWAMMLGMGAGAKHPERFANVGATGSDKDWYWVLRAYGVNSRHTTSSSATLEPSTNLSTRAERQRQRRLRLTLLARGVRPEAPAKPPPMLDDLRQDPEEQRLTKELWDEWREGMQAYRAAKLSARVDAVSAPSKGPFERRRRRLRVRRMSYRSRLRERSGEVV